MKNLFKAIAQFRHLVSSVKKWADNPFFKSRYADLPSILEVIKDPLNESGLAVSHHCKSTESGFTVVTILGHSESGEFIESEFPVFWSKPQEVWSSISYARRYNLLALLDIPTEDDDGNASNEAPRTKTVSTASWGNKPQTYTSHDETCPECWIANHTKKGKTKDWRDYELAECEDCGIKYFINRK